MSNSSDYIITTLSSSIKQRTFKNGAVVAPFGMGIPGLQNLRGACQPYSNFPGGSNADFVRSDCVSAGGGGGGGGIPESIIARDNLVHWWKLNEGSDTTATDYGLSGSGGSTDMTLSGVTTDVAGPTENGTPAAISFDGVTDTAWAPLIDSGGTDTSIGDLFNESHGDGFTLSMWIKDDAATRNNWDIYWIGTTSNSWNDGMGTYFSTYTATQLYLWMNALWNGWRATKENTIPHSGWRNITMIYPDTSTGRTYKVYYDGVEVDSYGPWGAGNTPPSTLINSVADAKFSIASYVRPDGTSTYHTNISTSDIRLYNKVLTPAEISDIAAGDWT